MSANNDIPQNIKDMVRSATLEVAEQEINILKSMVFDLCNALESAAELIEEDDIDEETVGVHELIAEARALIAVKSHE